MKRLCKLIATLGPIGYLVAPGTVATLICAPVALWAMSDKLTGSWQLLLAVFASLLSVAVIGHASSLFANGDPSEIVLDELVGCLFVFFNMPVSLPILVSGIIVFRVLDVTKIFGLRYIEKMNGAWGVVLDDVCAGIMANLLLRAVLQFI